MVYVPSCSDTNSSLPIEVAIDDFLKGKPNVQFAEVLVLPSAEYIGIFEEQQLSKLLGRAYRDDSTPVYEHVIRFDHSSIDGVEPYPVVIILAIQEQFSVPKPLRNLDFLWFTTCGHEVYYKEASGYVQ